MSGKRTPRKKEKNAAFHSPEGKVPPEHLAILEALRNSKGEGGKVSFDDMVRPYYGEDYLEEQKKAKEALDSWNPIKTTDPFIEKYGSSTPEEISKILRDEQRFRRDGDRKFSFGGVSLDGASQFQREQKRNVVFSHSRNGDMFGMRAGEPMEDLGGAVYLPESKTVHTVDPSGLNAGPEGKTIRGIFNQNDKEWGKAFSEDPEKQFLSVLEHELGHGVGGFNSSDKPINGNYANHMALPAELINGLGKVNRERFLMTGKRFESGLEFREFFKSEMEKPHEQRFRGFSEEAKRTWRVLGDDENGDIPRNDMKKILDVSEKIIPGLVEKESSIEEDTMLMVRNYFAGRDNYSIV